MFHNVLFGAAVVFFAIFAFKLAFPSPANMRVSPAPSPFPKLMLAVVFYVGYMVAKRYGY